MSYTSIAACAVDPSFMNRLTACAAQEGHNPPQDVMAATVWPIAGHTDIAAAYESALAAGNPDPGGDPAVITDQMILSAFQSHAPAP